MSSVSFKNPYLLFIIIPLIIVVLIGFFIMEKKSRRNLKNIISLSLHLLICVLVTLASADMSILQAETKTDLYVIADVSYSNAEDEEKIDNYIKQINAQIDSKTSLGVICFGKNYEVLTPLGGSIKSVKNSRVDRSATDLEGALKYTNSLFSQDAIKRMILITDGVETDNSALNALEDLIKNDVYIDAIYLNEPLSYNEVQINQINYSSSVYLNHESSLKVFIQSSNNTDCKVKLINNNDEKSLQVKLTRGINVINFDLDTSTAGVFDYEVKIETPNDKIAENNSFLFRQEVVSKVKVLLVSDNTRDFSEINKLYSDDAEIDPYIGTYNVPTSIGELCKYDEIVLSNINLLQIENYEEFIFNLEAFVSLYGKSLVTFGATYANGDVSETLRRYNGMLPVQFEASDAKALALVIDCSSSMMEEDRLDRAKEGAIACLDLLSEKDYVTIIAFGENVKVVQPLTSASNKSTIIDAINAIDYSYATMMGAGLKSAYSQLRNVNLDDKQVIVLTDGQPHETQSELEKIVYDMNKDNIVSSFINISCREGESLLKSLAKFANGLYYYVGSSADLVNIILSSVANEVVNTKIEGDFNVNVRMPNDNSLTDISELPLINGYNYSRIKTSASTVLTVTYTNEDGGSREVPLYAYWEYGKGKVSSFTSNIGSNWTKDFRASEAGKSFLTSFISNSLPKERVSSPFLMEVTNNGFTSSVSVSVPQKSVGFIKMKVTSPQGNTEEKFLKYNNSSYYGIFTTNEKGLYRVSIEYYMQGKTVIDEQIFFFSYSKEYKEFVTKDESLLYKLTKNRGKVSTDVEYIMLGEEIENRYSLSLALPFLVIAMALFIIDIFVRKTKIKHFLIKK